MYFKRGIFPVLCCLASVINAKRFDHYIFKKPDTNRNISIQVNPGCNIAECKKSNDTLVYVRLQAEYDSLHYLIAVGNDVGFSVLFLKSGDPESHIRVSWKDYLSDDLTTVNNAIQILKPNAKPASIISQNAFVINQILEYNDTSGKADFNDSTNVFYPPISFAKLDWSVWVDEDVITLQGQSFGKSFSFNENSTIAITFSPYSSSGRSNEPPKLPHTSNSTDVKIILNDLVTRGSASRYAIELLLVADYGHVFKEHMKHTVDDEYAPTIFQTDSIMWKQTNVSREPEMFCEWRKVSYKTADHSVKFQSNADISNSSVVRTTTSDIYQNKLFRGYYGNNITTNQKAHSVVVTFGRADDVLYNATKYLSWTLSVGFGEPPSDTFSLLVISILSAAVGIPVAIIIFGAILLLIKNILKKNEYTAIDSSYDPIS